MQKWTQLIVYLGIIKSGANTCQETSWARTHSEDEGPRGKLECWEERAILSIKNMITDHEDRAPGSAKRRTDEALKGSSDICFLVTDMSGSEWGTFLYRETELGKVLVKPSVLLNSGDPDPELRLTQGANKAGRVHPQTVRSQLNPGVNRGSVSLGNRTIGQSALSLRRSWVRWWSVEKGLKRCEICHASPSKDNEGLKSVQGKTAGEQS